MSRAVRITSWIVAAALALGAAPARGADVGGEDASTLIHRGVELRREHRNEEALELFKRAVALSPTPLARAQLALAEQALARWVDAERDLELALAAASDDWIVKNRASLVAARDIIRQHLAWIAVDVDVEGASIRLDGVALTRGVEARVTSGEAVLEVKATDYAPDARRVLLPAGDHVRLVVALARLVAPAAPVVAAVAPPVAKVDATPVVSSTVPASPPTFADERVSSPSRVVPITFGIVGFVGVGIGSIYGIRTFVEKSDRDKSCASGCTPTSLRYDASARSSATTSTIAMGAGLGFIAVGAIGWLLDVPRASAPHAGLEVSPIVGGVTGLSLRGDF